MLRKAILGLFVVASIAGAASTGSANPVSKYNPYRSFNASGVNYGSMKWERDHRYCRSAYRGHHHAHMAHMR